MNIKQTQKGFTLIELMIVIAIIGILADVALPAYSDYTKRAKMSEVILAASSCRTDITENVQNGGLSASGANSFGCESASPTSKYVASVATTALGAITVTSQNIDGSTTVTLTPYSDDGASVLEANGTVIFKWGCASSNQAIMPASCEG